MVGSVAADGGILCHPAELWERVIGEEVNTGRNEIR
jgi:hypothetical protein